MSIRRVLVVMLIVTPAVSWCDDWPTYLHDSARSGVTSEQLPAGLHLIWQYQPSFPPNPAWPAPAKQDFWHEIRELRPVVTYDRAFHAVVAGGDLLFGSSSDDRVYCLDAETGALRWTFSCEGPVRLAPSIWNGKAYFGSDDGWAYCVRVSDGQLVWKHRPNDNDRRLPGNGRVISLRPVRTGVLVDGGVAYYCAGLFPPDDVYRCALDAETGQVLWQTPDAEASPQGYMLANASRLFVPTGRTSPFTYDRASGRLLGPMAGPGGAYALLVDDAVVSGPGLRTGPQAGIAAEPRQEGVASFPCVHMVVSSGIAYLQGKESLRALDRHEYVRLAVEQRGVQEQRKEADKLRDKALGQGNRDELRRLTDEMRALDEQIAALGRQMDACFKWTREDDEPYALILAGDTLYSGGEGKITAVRAADGREVWSSDVEGRIYGFSAANGRLYASSDTGAIYCFGAGSPAAAQVPEKTAAEPAAKSELAATIASLSGFEKGYCILLGYETADIALDVARGTDLSVLMAVADESRARALRGEMLAAGVSPSRVTAHCVEADTLPYTTYMANVVVCKSPGAISAAEVYRLLRPYGGTALVAGDKAETERWLVAAGLSAEKHEAGFTVLRRGAVDGAGEWTQLYANPSHTASSGETLTGPLGIQWFGKPGPRDIVDRHHRPMSPLFKDGRLFVMGNERIFAVDPYNGTLFYTIEAPGSRRVGALKNSGHALIESDRLYLAVKDECWVFDVADGRRVGTFEVPKPAKWGEADWGYLNCVGDRLFGTGQKSGASFSALSRAMVDVLEGDFRPVVISDYAFCLNRNTGKRKWMYRDGAILNNGLAAADDRLFLIESHEEKALDSEDGRVRVDVFCRDARLVALNAKNGKKVWERKLELPFHHIMYLSGAKDTLLITGSYNQDEQVYYGLFAFDMDTGKPKWNTSYLAMDVGGKKPAPTGGTHGEQWQHPVIIAGTIYSRPYAFDLETGEKEDYIAYRGGHGCGGLTGSARYLFGRGSNPRMYPTDVPKTDGIPLTLVSRPGCWLNIIPAGGLIMIPESSSGCTCAYPLQTSIALVPQDQQ